MLRPCLDCGQLSDRNRCSQHRTTRQQQRDKRRGTTTQRGYGVTHQQERTAWVPAVATGTVRCRRCDQPIAPGAAWDLGHPDAECPKSKAPEHAYRCNRAAAGRSSPG